MSDWKSDLDKSNAEADSAPINWRLIDQAIRDAEIQSQPSGVYRAHRRKWLRAPAVPRTLHSLYRPVGSVIICVTLIFVGFSLIGDLRDRAVRGDRAAWPSETGCSSDVACSFGGVTPVEAQCLKAAGRDPARPKADGPRVSGIARIGRDTLDYSILYDVDDSNLTVCMRGGDKRNSRTAGVTRVTIEGTPPPATTASVAVADFSLAKVTYRSRTLYFAFAYISDVIQGKEPDGSYTAPFLARSAGAGPELLDLGSGRLLAGLVNPITASTGPRTLVLPSTSASPGHVVLKPADFEDAPTLEVD